MAKPCCTGPGYASPLDAFRSGERETLAYVPVTTVEHERPDYLATIDVDPASKTFSEVIARLEMPNLGDELHHSGWNACSSCFAVNPSGLSRSRLILPALSSSRIYGERRGQNEGTRRCVFLTPVPQTLVAVDVATDPRAPRLDKVLEPQEILSQTGLSTLHTSHCLGDGTVLVRGRRGIAGESASSFPDSDSPHARQVSAMGNEADEPRGGFFVLDQQLQVVGPWSKEVAPFGYDYWVQYGLNVLVSSGWGAPSAFKKGFNPADVEAGKYASQLYIWDFGKRTLVQTLELGAEGSIPLETRFLHDPKASEGYVGAALASNVLRFHKVSGGEDVKADVGAWAAEVAIRQAWTPVTGWALPEMPPLITDILLSLDDRYLYLSNWLRGDVCQYDISDTAAPRLVGRVWLGGSMVKGGGVTVTGGEFKDAQPEAAVVKGKTLRGGPQMLQLSLDGKRLYVTSSLFSPWDKQFYPELVAEGSWMVLLIVDTVRGGLAIDPSFLIDFGKEPGGPGLAHEVRFPGGDSTSDIWV